MDFFEKFVFEELENTYANDSLEAYEYQDVYERFMNLNYLEEVKPYLYAMRFLGKGTKAEPDAVLKELEKIELPNCQIRGLYLDIKLLRKKGNIQDIAELEKCVANGYSTKFLRDKSYLSLKADEEAVDAEPEKVCIDCSTENEKVIFKSMSFEGCGYSGLYFTSGDIDYLKAKVFIEPVKTTCHLSVRSQIYAGKEPFSKVLSNEFTLKPGDTWFIIPGWGNKKFNSYPKGVYRWVVEFDGNENDTHSQEFCFYAGEIKKSGLPVKDIKLFASKASGPLEKDRDQYYTAFNKESLEYVYFKLFIEEPEQDTAVQIFLKVICLDDNSVFYDKYILHYVTATSYAFSEGIGFKQRGKWKAGLYKYSIHVGTGPVYDGTFTVY